MPPTRVDLLREWPRFLDGYVYIADDDLHRFPKQEAPPEGIVWHSGDVGRKLGEYSTNEPDGRCIAYTFPWFDTLGGFVQSVPLDVRAWHGGRGNGWIGAGLPGPWHQRERPPLERLACQRLAVALMEAFPGVLRYWCRHSDYDESRFDPGPGFRSEWMTEIGLEWRLPPGCRLVRR